MHLKVILFSVAVVLAPTSSFAASLYLDPLFGVQKTSNITYGTGLVNNGGSSIDLKLDFYQPTDIGTPVPASRPTILFMHGGGWQGGNKNSVAQANVWVSRGYNVASINYRLLGNNPPLTTGPADDYSFLAFLGPPGIISAVNASIEDANLALDWLAANSASYGIDTSRVGLTGHSAGAVMSLILTYLDPSTSVQTRAVLSSLGALFNDPSPFDAGDPPAMLIAGETDLTVPAFFVSTTSQQMTAAGVENALYIQPSTAHSTNWNSVFDGQTLSQHGIDFWANNLALVSEPSTVTMTAMGMIFLLLGCFVSTRRRRVTIGSA